MEKIVFNCETITPMFLAGADGKTPELRPPSIKAAMRFWWRALHPDWEKNKSLRDKEEEFFGGTNIQNHKSSFTIRCSISSDQQQSSLKDKIWDSNRNSVKNEFEGLGYLLYSTFMQRDANRPYFEKLSFNVDIISNDSMKLVEAANLFWFMSIFGAFGCRARRGAGNFTIAKINGDKKLIGGLSILEYKNQVDLKTFLEQTIQKFGSGLKNQNPSYTNFSNIRVFILPPQNDAYTCLEILGRNYKKFRSRRQPDYSGVKNYLTGKGSPTTIEKAVMGLPISYRYRSLNGKSASIDGSDDKRQRSASPIFFKVIRTQFQEKLVFFPLVLIAFRDLLPNGDKILLKEPGRNPDVSPAFVGVPSAGLLYTYINDLPSFVEVKI